jgi:hypothetical protein
MSYDKEFATVIVACEVSFGVGHMNYGTISVPAGAKVFRHNVNGKVSDWFLLDDDLRKLCPEAYKGSSFYLHDAMRYGISLPNANVRNEGTPCATHRAYHY